MNNITILDNVSSLEIPVVGAQISSYIIQVLKYLFIREKSNNAVNKKLSFRLT